MKVSMIVRGGQLQVRRAVRKTVFITLTLNVVVLGVFLVGPAGKGRFGR